MTLSALERQFAAAAEFEQLDESEKAALAAVPVPERNLIYRDLADPVATQVDARQVAVEQLENDRPTEPDEAFNTKIAEAETALNAAVEQEATIQALPAVQLVRAVHGIRRRYVVHVIANDTSTSLRVSRNGTQSVLVEGFTRLGGFVGDALVCTTQQGRTVTEVATAGFDAMTVARSLVASLEG